MNPNFSIQTLKGRKYMTIPVEENAEETRKIKVLIADDEESFSRAIVFFLHSTNLFEVDSVESGIDALQALKQKEYNVLILDYKMPELSGIQVLQKMLEDKIETPAIMLTGAGSEKIAAEAIKLGAYDYVRKDLFDLHHLPILLNGVHERFLFKKERLLYEDLHKQKGHNLATAELTRNYISINAQLLNTTLSMISMVIEDTEKELNLNLPQEAKLYIEEAYGTLKESYRIISFGTKSLLNLTRTISSRLEGTIDVQHDVEELDAKLAILKEKMQTVMK
jgi:FixJ family two-component response regulator